MNESLGTSENSIGLWRAVCHAMAGVIALSATVLLSACVSPVEDLWPPTQDSATQTIYVSLDTWHAMIAFQVGTPDASRFTPHAYEEWGYAERTWYLEGQTGLTGIVRALFWPTDGVVEVGHYDRVWADRTPQPPSELFVFRVSEESHRRLRRHLRETISVSAPIASPGRSTFYPAVRSYHLFHTCHQYAAYALREAGLPISPFWAFNRTSLAWQLRRAARHAAEQPTEAPIVGSR
jgi:hypothetical protein